MSAERNSDAGRDSPERGAVQDSPEGDAVQDSPEGDAGRDSPEQGAGRDPRERGAGSSEESPVDVLRRATRIRQARQARILDFTNQQLALTMSRIQRSVDDMIDGLAELDQCLRDQANPQIRNWEADLLTRLVEVAHYKQSVNLGDGRMWVPDHTYSYDTMTHRYRSAARAITLHTLEQLGLDDRYHRMLSRYDQFVGFRSGNPLSTESEFARWLVHSEHYNGQKFDFWNPLFRICYGRTVRESAALI
ncbi:hypothetical protein N7454_008956 [Penicillium verhagenii]|nr:hypothetical protein N7454_008956 [Penicillium verhagenii]